MTLTWYDGKQWPKSPEGVDLSKWHLGTMFIGEIGILVADYGRYVLLPEAQFKDFQAPQPWIGPSLGHHQEWIHACKTGEPTLCNFDYSGTLVEHNLLGTVAFRTGTKLEWDAEHSRLRTVPKPISSFVNRIVRDGRSKRITIGRLPTYGSSPSFRGAAHSTALAMILRTLVSKKTGLVSCPAWK